METLGVRTKSNHRFIYPDDHDNNDQGKNDHGKNDHYNNDHDQND